MRFFSKYTWRLPVNSNEVFLTFDDGPTLEITEFVLSELKKYNAKATFFCIGKNIKKQSNTFNKIISEGHAIGNHTQNHLQGWKTNNQKYLKSVLECENIIANWPQKVNNSKLFRPPYGKIRKSQARNLLKNGYKIIMWDVLSGDFDSSISNERCLQNVLKNTRNGSIIVFHDSVKAAEKIKYALPRVLKALSDKGFSFSKIE
jgi:peptidoglycan/xylan/chitin deacetylase (PgdA/CDA1 family)